MSPMHFMMGLFVPAAWGLGFTLAKIGMAEFPPFMIMTLRFAIAAGVLVWFAPPPLHRLPLIFLIALISATIQYGLTFYGLNGLDASTAVLVVQLEAPFMALIATVVLKEAFGLKRGVGMALAFIGVAVIAGEPRLDGNLSYVFLVMGGAFVWAVGQVMVSRLRDVDSLTLLAWVAVFAAPQMAVASWLIEDGQWQAIQAAGPTQWLIVAYLGLIMTVAAYGVWYRLLHSVPINQAAPFMLLTPVTSIIAGVLLLDEVITGVMAIGAVLVLGGVATMTIHRRPKG